MESKDILKSDVLDIIFEGRNKEYGAYELRKNYRKRTKNALIGCMVFATILASIPVIASLINKSMVKPKPMTKVTELIAPPPMDEKKPTPPPPPPPPPPVKPQVKFTPPVIKKAEEVRDEEKPPPKQELEKATASTVTVKGDENAKLEAPDMGPGPATIEPVKEVKDEIFEFVEQEAQFPGGEDALFRYLSEHIKYPNAAREGGIEGRVILSFVVRSDGNITDVKVSRGIGYGCDEEATRVVKGMPNWKAGKQNGKQVSSTFSLPVVFQLEE